MSETEDRADSQPAVRTLSAPANDDTTEDSVNNYDLSLGHEHEYRTMTYPGKLPETRCIYCRGEVELSRTEQNTVEALLRNVLPGGAK